MKDYYRILQAHREADQETIKAAYRSLTRRVHPDKNPNNREWAEKRMREINEAYDVLSDNAKRAAFDREYPVPSENRGFASSDDLLSALEKNRALRDRVQKLTALLERQDGEARELQRLLEESVQCRERLEKELAVERERNKLLRRGLSSAEEEAQIDEERQPPVESVETRVMKLPGGSMTMVFVRIPASTFEMGSKLGNPDERPVHQAAVDGFWIGAEPVTCRQFSAFIKVNPSWSKRSLLSDRHSDYLKPFNGDNPPFGKERHPVTHVTWAAAAAFAKWAGFELPTEAQWECAARGGQGGEYGGGRSFISPNAANFAGKRGGVVPTRSYPPNAYGVYEMLGNVWEWCADVYDESFYSSPEASEPNPMRVGVGAGDGSARRVIRGGSWQSLSSDLRVSARGHMKAETASMFCGFRCAFRER